MNARFYNKGFSLIELMIVIAILGIIAALAIPAYDDYIIRAKVSNMLSASNTVQEAVAESRQVNGNFNAIVPGDPSLTFQNLGITDPTTLTPALSAVLFVSQDIDHVAIVLCGATIGQGSPDDADTVDLYLTGTYYISGMKWGCEYQGNSNYVPISCRTLYQNSLYGTLAGACPRVAPTPTYQ